MPDGVLAAVCDACCAHNTYNTGETERARALRPQVKLGEGSVRSQHLAIGLPATLPQAARHTQNHAGGADEHRGTGKRHRHEYVLSPVIVQVKI